MSDHMIKDPEDSRLQVPSHARETENIFEELISDLGWLQLLVV